MVGNWLDDGSFDDWLANDTDRNRGKLYVLDSNPASGIFQKTEITGDGLVPGSGLSSGVFGVKIDDVDGDGQAEIWAGDANGALHLFQKQGATWTRVFQSEDLAPYAGWWNGIFPIKGVSGVTVGLVLRTTGYWMMFEVHPSVLFGS